MRYNDPPCIHSKTPTCILCEKEITDNQYHSSPVPMWCMYEDREGEMRETYHYQFVHVNKGICSLNWPVLGSWLPEWKYNEALTSWAEEIKN